MALVLTEIDRTQRPWGWEVRVDALWEATGEIIHRMVVFDHAPSVEERTAARQAIRDSVLAELADRPARIIRELRERLQRAKDEVERLRAELLALGESE